MTVQNPAIFIQSESHPAEDVRRMFSALLGGATTGANGICEAGDLAVSEKSGTPDMSVDVAEGACWIDGDEATYQGSYFCENRGVTNLSISAADATNPRKDLIVAKVQDSAYSGATDAWSLAVVTGTPAASPSEPAVPSNAIVLALVDVAALASSIVDGNITDRRVTTQEGRAPKGYVVTTSAALPTNATEGDIAYTTNTDSLLVYSGSEWTPPKNTAWGVDDTVSADVGVHQLSASGDWTNSVTLRSDRKYLITGFITAVPSDIVEAGGVNEMTRMQMTVTYNAVNIAISRFGYEEYYWSDNASAHTNADEGYRSQVIPFSAIVTGTGSSANIVISFADSIGRGYDFECVGSNYSQYTITDIGPA